VSRGFFDGLYLPPLRVPRIGGEQYLPFLMGIL